MEKVLKTCKWIATRGITESSKKVMDAAFGLSEKCVKYTKVENGIQEEINVTFPNVDIDLFAGYSIGSIRERSKEIFEMFKLLTFAKSNQTQVHTTKFEGGYVQEILVVRCEWEDKTCNLYAQYVRVVNCSALRWDEEKKKVVFQMCKGKRKKLHIALASLLMLSLGYCAFVFI